MILIVGNDREEVDGLRLKLYKNNLPTGAASTTTFHFHMGKGIYDFVIVIGSKGIFLRNFFRRLHHRYPDVPSILIGHPSKTQVEEFSMPDLLISGRYTPVSLIKDIERISRKRGIKNPITLAVGTLRHDIKNAAFICFHEYFSPPAAEAAILHVLMDRYPEPIGADALMRLAAKPGRKPSPSSLAPSVSRLNKRTEETIGRRVAVFRAGAYRFVATKTELDLPERN